MNRSEMMTHMHSCASAHIFLVCAVDQRAGQQLCRQMGALAKTSLGDGKCQCKVSPQPPLLFAFHMG